MSADEQVSLEGDLQGSISMAQGDGYSRVVKRTVVKSEGDHTEVRVLYILCVHKSPFNRKYQTHQQLCWYWYIKENYK